MMQSRYYFRFLLALLCAATFLIPEDASAQSWQWARKAGGTRGDTAGGIGLDAEGNSYITGTFHGDVTFNSTTFSNGQNTGIYLAKYNAQGALQWAAQGNGLGNFLESRIAVDDAGNCYLTGSFLGTVNFGGSILTSAGGSDIFLAKYNATGILQWLRRLGGAGDDRGGAITIDSVGDPYLAGSFTQTFSVGDVDLNNAGGTDIIAAKYNTLGELKWLTAIGGTGADMPAGIGVDWTGSSYITGSFETTVQFGPNSLTSAGEEDIFVAKLGPSGSVVWGVRMGSTGDDRGMAIIADRFGNNYVAGSFRGNARFETLTLASAGEEDIFVAKLDGLGGMRWASRAGGAESDAAYGITVDGLGTSIITGSFGAAATFGTMNLQSAGAADIFVAKYGGTGDLQTAVRAGAAREERGIGVDVASDGEIYLTGWFDTTTTIGEVTLNSSGRTDIFTARLGAPSTITTNPIVGNPFCSGAPMVITFTTTGVYNSQNVFTAQLSDSTGSFDRPTVLGTLEGTGDGSFNINLPTTLPTGTRYRIRVISNNPVVTGADNGTDLTIYGRVVPTVTPNGSLKLCQGETITLDAGPGYTSYQWSTGAVTRTISVSQAGSYTVTVANDAGCVGISDSVKVEVAPAPAKPAVVHVGGALESTPADRYEWLRNGEPIPNATNRRYVPGEPGIYAVRVFDINGCSAVSDPVDLTSGVAYERGEGVLSLYPHPNRGLFTVELAVPHAADVRITVMDALGRMVTSHDEESQAGRYVRRIDITGAAAGIYYVLVETGRESFVREVIKQ